MPDGILSRSSFFIPLSSRHLKNAPMKQSPAPDKMKDQMGWTAHMNTLKAQAEEVILQELIYS